MLAHSALEYALVGALLDVGRIIKSTKEAREGLRNTLRDAANYDYLSLVDPVYIDDTDDDEVLPA